MAANDTQVGGTHYKLEGKPQHWDLVLLYGWDYFTGQVTKYLMRWRSKNGIEDLKKARHYLDKLIEAAEAGVEGFVPDARVPVKWIEPIRRVSRRRGKGKRVARR